MLIKENSIHRIKKFGYSEILNVMTFFPTLKNSLRGIKYNESNGCKSMQKKNVSAISISNIFKNLLFV